MPVTNRIADFAEDMKIWRRHLHQHPEIGFDCHETAAFVVDRLREFGVDEIHEKIATSGVVAIINGQGDGPTIGLRADFDALPMEETSGIEWASCHPGKMHACGHDGHTTMLLGAARYLAETRNFAGRVALIFQPAEESGGGANVMVKEGILDRYNISEVYAVHTLPEKEVGHIYTVAGPIMAAVDDFHIHITGRGGHGAYPHETSDPIVAAVGIVSAIQTIVSRNHYALDDLVVSVTQIHSGSTENIVPETAYISGTVRSFSTQTRQMVARRMQELVDGQAAAYGVSARLDYQTSYPATVNDEQKVAFAAGVAAQVVGEEKVSTAVAREMGAEDFAYMLERRPGAYLYITQGEGPGVHHPEFDFNDEISPIGASFFARLVEVAQPVKG